MQIARRTHAAICVLAIATLAGAAALTGGPATAAAPAAANGPRVAVGARAAVPAGAHELGAAAASAKIDFNVVLQPRDPAALANFVQQVSDPSSAQFRHYLKPGTFADRFGASPGAIAAVSNALRAAGLTVHVPTDGLSLAATGTVARVRTALGTSLARYRLPSGQVALANTGTPTLPASVAALVQGVVGLDQLDSAQSDTRLRPAAAAGSAVSSPLATTVQPAVSGPAPCLAAQNEARTDDGYTANQIAQHYGLDSLYAAGDLGQHVTIALTELEPFLASDVAAYQSCYGTSASVSVKTVGGGAGTGAGEGEAALDVEDVIGLAPSANVVVYEAPNNNFGLYDIYQQIASDDSAQVVSDSWGLCEAENSPSTLAALERPLFQQMAAQGQTVLAATGDSGSEGCFAPPDDLTTSLSVWDPASQPEVTAVGGTSVASVSAPDTAWGDEFGASGGGISAVWPMPAYQRPTAVIADSSGAPCGAVSGQACREVPDVSADADLAGGYVKYFGGSWYVDGGTSAAAPTWGALIALVDSGCSAGAVGFVNPALYALNAAGSTALVDVSSGPDNDYTETNGGRYQTRIGYDLTTGLGRPAAASLAGALCPTTAAGGRGSATVTPSLVSPGTVTTLTFSYTPASGHGMVDGEIDVTAPGTWSTPQTTNPTGAGYVSASAGVPSVSGNTIQVRGITVPAGAAVTIVYGDTTGGSSGAIAPSQPQASTFTVADRTTRTGALTQLTISPSVRVLAANGDDNEGALVRVAGSDRIATAIAASQQSYPTLDSAGAIVLARSDTYPDALAGVPLAAYTGGPLLLTTPGGLTTAVQQEIERVLAPGRTVYLLGGPTALSGGIDAQLRAMGYITIRLQGTDRYDTAVKIANALGDPSTVFEADGTNFPDALSAGTAAISEHGCVLLTAGKKQSPETASYLALHAADSRDAIGGPAAAADPGATPFIGSDRYATSVLVAEHFFQAPGAVGLASGLAFPDALSGGPVAAGAGGPLVLVPPTGALPATSAAYLSQLAESVLTGWVFGGASAVSTTIADDAAQLLVLVPPPS